MLVSSAMPTPQLPADPSLPAGPGSNELRWQLLRDLAVFSAKVAVEAIRDIVLIPLALVAGVVGLVLSPEQPDRYFRDVLRLGDRFDGFVDLFGAEAERREEREGSRIGGLPSMEQLLTPLEEILRDQHARGGVTSTAKQAIDRALDSAHRVVGKASDPATQTSNRRGEA